MINLPFHLTSIFSPEGGRWKGEKILHSYHERRLRINESSLFCQAIFFWIFLVFPNGPIMFFDVRRKVMRPVILGNEIKVRNRSGTNGGQKRVPARITDGSGGKSSQEIGIIRSMSQ
jgi:hypothetical protein